ncbi:hypothetical protein M0R45_021047 [Rubus argutus]|uniref:Uncharacterized protein n=1 Tax=Rubus argutus TaxID=59490 RepID=A0AAW1XBI3_RUBAR
MQGLVLFWVSVKVMTGDATRSTVFYIAAVLLAFGEAGRPAALCKFLDDKYLSEENAEEDAKRVETRQSALWNHPWALGAAAPLFFINTSLKTQVMVSTILMVVSYLLFWCGLFCYPNNNPNKVNAEDPDMDRLSTTVCKVIDSLSPDKQTGRWKFWLKPMERKRYYKEMLAMCFAFIAYSLVEATGNTFFFNQTDFMEDKIGNFKIPILYFGVLRSFSSFISSFLCWKLIRKKWKHATLIRIGCGLVCSVLCCAVAWQVELRRSHKIKTEVTNDNSIISMSVLWLIPQFSLLGVMRGLAVEGLVEFFADGVVEDDGKLTARYYGWHAGDFVLGIGRLMTAVSILVLRHTWLDESIYRNRLDKYYRGLTFLGLANLCFYLLVASYFYKKDKHSPSSAADENEERPTERPKLEKPEIGNDDECSEGVKSNFVSWCTSCCCCDCC